MAEVTETGILFADIAGSVRLYETLGDEAAHGVVDGCLRMIGETVALHGGAVIKTIGDEVMAAFADPVRTCAAAVAIHRRIRDDGPRLVGGHPFRIAMRIGFQFGPAVREGGDLYGDGVNVAARLTTLAKANQILTTAAVLPLLSQEQRAGCAALGQIDVKGRAAPVAVAKVEWEEQPGGATVLQLKGEDATQAHAPDLRLVFRRRSWHVPAGQRSLACGRDPASDLLLTGTQSSRAHATIERRGGRIVLVDHSTNGTYLHVDNRETLKLHRDEVTLLRNGLIRFGAADGEDVDQLLYFID